MRFEPGELVEVLSQSEIRATLDSNFRLEGMPFMPEMAAYCGMRFRVLKRPEKVVVEGRGALRQLRNAVILEDVTCSGEAHGGCQGTCAIFWKDQWLKHSACTPTGVLSEPSAQTIAVPQRKSDGLFSCQSTDLFAATNGLHLWDMRHHVQDIRKGTLRFRVLARTLWIVYCNQVRRRLGLRKHYLFHGKVNPTPTRALALRPGELVQVRTREEIAMTLDARGRNRGLGFTQEMLGSCGGKYKVMKRLDRMVVETTGKMQEFADTVLLEGARCSGESHFGCQRGCSLLFKEIWLERMQ